MNPYTDNPELDALVRERMETLPAPVRRIFDDPASPIYIESFAASAGLSEEQTQQLQHEIMLLMLGFTERDDFSFVLMTELDMPPRQAFAVEHWVTNIFLKDVMGSIGTANPVAQPGTASSFPDGAVQLPESGVLVSQQYTVPPLDMPAITSHPMQGSVMPPAAPPAPMSVPTPYGATITQQTPPVQIPQAYGAPQAFTQPPVAVPISVPTTQQQYVPPTPTSVPTPLPPIATIVATPAPTPQHAPQTAVPTPQPVPVAPVVVAQPVVPLPPVATIVQATPPVVPTTQQTTQTTGVASQSLPTSVQQTPPPVQPINMPTGTTSAVPIRLTPPPVAAPTPLPEIVTPPPSPLPVVTSTIPSSRPLTPPVPRIASGSLDINKPLPKPHTIFQDIAAVRGAISPEGVARYDKPFAQAPAYGVA